MTKKRGTLQVGEDFATYLEWLWPGFSDSFFRDFSWDVIVLKFKPSPAGSGEIMSPLKFNFSGGNAHQLIHWLEQHGFRVK
jgi:hypothetical protein